MRILIIGAGPLGSLMAARLYQGGHDAVLLARGKRFRELEEYGVMLRPWSGGETETINMLIVEKFLPADTYDAVLVVMRKNNALDALPMLAENKRVPIFLFLMNNASGPQKFEDALGKERVVMGFPGAAGYRDGHEVVHLNGEADRNMEVVIGKGNRSNATRINHLAQALKKGRYMDVVIEPFMDSWSKFHVALLFPSIAPALYLCGNDRMRMSRTRDALVLAWRAIREGFSALKILGYPVRPTYLRRFLYIPEPLAVHFFGKLMMNPRMEVAMERHAEVIRDEIQQLNGEFMELVNRSGLYTPNINFLVGQYNKKAPTLPDGSRSVHIRWSELLTPILLLILLGLILATVL